MADKLLNFPIRYQHLFVTSHMKLLYCRGKVWQSKAHNKCNLSPTVLEGNQMVSF